MTQDIVHSLTIQSVINDQIVLSLVSYMLSVISRETLRELSRLKIKNNVSITGV
jgi:hypothetical protein